MYSDVRCLLSLTIWWSFYLKYTFYQDINRIRIQHKGNDICLLWAMRSFANNSFGLINRQNKKNTHSPINSLQSWEISWHVRVLIWVRLKMKAVLKPNAYLCTLALGTNPTHTQISIDIFTFGVIQVNRIYFFNCLSMSILLNKSFNNK